MRFRVLCSSILLLAAAASGGERAGKSEYTITNPTPSELMRELSPDRPDATESPLTVDAGHFQLEADIIAYTRDRRDDVISFLPVNLKAGLTNDIDVQLILEPFVIVDPANGPREEGFGDITLRVKWNLYGNDGERPTALAVMPFIKFPTAEDGIGNDEVEGGVIVPWGTDLGEGFGLGAQVEVAVVDDGRGEHRFEFSQTIVVGQDVTERIGVFIELFSNFAEGDREWIGTFNTGLTYAVDENTVLDFGAFIGLVSDADDVVLFVGITRRF